MSKKSTAQEWADIEQHAEDGVSSWDVCLVDIRDQIRDIHDDYIELSRSVAITNRAIHARLDRLEEGTKAPNKPSAFQMPSLQQVDYWAQSLLHRSDMEVFAMAAKWGYDQALKSCQRSS